MKRWLIGLAALAASLVPMSASASSLWVESSNDMGQYVVVTDGASHVVFEVAPLDKLTTSLWLPMEPVGIWKDTNGQCLALNSFILWQVGGSDQPVCAVPVWAN